MSPTKFALLALGAAALGGTVAHVFLSPATLTVPAMDESRQIARKPLPPASVVTEPSSPSGASLASEVPVPAAPAIAGMSATAPPLPPPPPSNAEKIATLREILARLPEQSIPELKLLTEADWHRAVDAGLDTPEDVRRALAALRAAGENRLIKAIQPALKEYVRANGGAFPADPTQLQPLVPAQIEPAMLQRYRVAPASAVPTVGVQGDSIITQAVVIDSEYHVTLVLGKDGMGSTTTPPVELQALSAVLPLQKAYRAAHGSDSRDFQLLQPYATTPEQYAAIQTLKKAQDKAQEKRKAR